MNEEEKQAIKYFYNLRATIDESNMLFDEDINIKCGKEMIKQITTVLNLLEKKDINIIEAKEANRQLSIELQKKDKMIEYMANFINDNTPYTKDTKILENERGVRNTKYTEQYFEYKVTDTNVGERKVENG